MAHTYKGLPLLKFPEDLEVYERLIELSRPDVVIELGTHEGGSALWFRDRVAQVISVNKTQTKDIDGVVLVEGDLLDPELPERVAQLIPDGSRCLVSEDSAHTYATTIAALNGFSRFVPAGGFFVVEDGCVDIEEQRLESWPRGVLPAIRDWLEGNEEFRMRRDLEPSVTTNPEGYLERIG